MSDPVRKPGETHQSFVERLIREAQADGEFDGVGGPGKRLPLCGLPLPEAWWAKEKMRRENLSDLPPSIAIRHEAEEILRSIARETDERIVRERLSALDAKIRRMNATTVCGPPTTLAPLDVEDLVRRWQEARDRARAGSGSR